MSGFSCYDKRYYEVVSFGFDCSKMNEYYTFAAIGRITAFIYKNNTVKNSMIMRFLFAYYICLFLTKVCLKNL